MKHWVTITFTIAISLVVSISMGVFAYVVLENLRVWAFCPHEFREGLDCYSPNWGKSSHWVFSFSAGVIGLVSICFTALLISTRRRLAVWAMYIIGLICAIPCAVLISSPWAYLAAVVLGGFAVYCVEGFKGSVADCRGAPVQ